MMWLEPLLAGTVVLVADQFSKQHVLAQRHYAGAVEHRPFFSIRCIINRRTAVMSLLGGWMLMAAWILCAAFALFSLTQEPLARSLVGAIGIGLAMGGITGNYIDMLRRGGIVDFIAIGSWPVFNLADAAVVSGLALALQALV